MTDLFAAATDTGPLTPLAERLRPKSIDDVIGQRHLLAPGKPLAVAFASGKPHSMILWGPPGVGKTTLARLMADAFNAEFIAISAVLAGVKDIRDAVARAELAREQYGRATILFVDEVHRFNKAQQDAFLPFVERGVLTFIGATTENPSFEVNSALLVACRRLRAGAVVAGRARRNCSTARWRPRCRTSPSTRPRGDALVSYADGDGRRLHQPRRATRRRPPAKRSTSRRSTSRSSRTRSRAACGASTRAAKRSTTRSPRCTRRCAARDPDASLYWMCRMLDGGADPLYVGARLIRMASEDIGLADPRALTHGARRRRDLRAARLARRRAGARAVRALSRRARRRATPSYTAYSAARAFIGEDGSRPVPMRLRNAPTKLMKGLGYGKGYRYAHDEADAYAAGERYLPDDMPRRVVLRADRPRARSAHPRAAARLRA